ncbi:hypothetical protein [Streptomyces sp. ISL-100]|uniref:hypothetical protein n=1 Tax=Streptomyces sp. ISL-100 TaxID=2819173 RepID=UPI001BE656D9|nr:hypothetical protein [Streptomyces sp. ISL-100]MBT2395387.1 hypothetical protein [Streptomyces sp. ISL-100]
MIGGSNRRWGGRTSAPVAAVRLLATGCSAGRDDSAGSGGGKITLAVWAEPGLVDVLPSAPKEWRYGNFLETEFEKGHPGADLSRSEIATETAGGRTSAAEAETRSQQLGHADGEGWSANPVQDTSPGYLTSGPT